MLEHGTQPLTFDRLMDALQGPTGWLELGIAATCVVLAYVLSRRIYAHWLWSRPTATGRLVNTWATAWCFRCLHSC